MVAFRIKFISKLLDNEKLRCISTFTRKTIIIAFFPLNVGIKIIDGLPDRSAIGTRFINLVPQYQAWSMLYLALLIKANLFFIIYQQWKK